ncbi:MAG: hypothetical protein ACI8RD_009767, partial [Bacillariaceae sp.]
HNDKIVKNLIVCALLECLLFISLDISCNRKNVPYCLTRFTKQIKGRIL